MSVSGALVDYGALSEPELVALAQAGRREAFGEIVQRCNQRLFRVARSIVRDDAEAEDVLQEAYVRAFSAFAGFRAEAGVLTWLTRITLNEARGRLRRRKAMVGVEAIEAAQAEEATVVSFPGGPAGGTPESDAARGEARRLLEHAIDDLPEPFRLVFTLREIEECTIEQTALHLGLKPETVKTRLHRARRMLRAALHDRLASAMTGAFPFLGSRCARMTERVLARLDRP
jgi:RNA polymerase sigma-70 factor (ECF subfamily)